MNACSKRDWKEYESSRAAVCAYALGHGHVKLLLDDPAPGVQQKHSAKLPRVKRVFIEPIQLMFVPGNRDNLTRAECPAVGNNCSNAAAAQL